MDWAVKASADDVSVATTTQTARRADERVLREIMFALLVGDRVSMFLITALCFVLKSLTSAFNKQADDDDELSPMWLGPT